MVSTAGRIARRCAAAAGGLLMPRACAGCGAEAPVEGGLCTACNVQLLELATLPYCPRCGGTIGPNLPIREDGCWMCPQPMPRFARVFRLGPYTGALRTAVRDLKYRRDETVLARLGRMLAESVASLESGPFDLVMPVATHWRRRLSRGYDHARALARAVARPLHLPVGVELIRVRHTPAQVGMSRSRRIENVRGAFTVRGKGSLEGACILLADDVTTTGATANEATRALLDAGASNVTLAVIAKSETPRAYAAHREA